MDNEFSAGIEAARLHGDYSRIRAAIARSPWAILPEKLAEICAVIDTRARGELVPHEQIVAAVEAGKHRSVGVRQEKAIAVVPVMGSIFQRANLVTESSGGTSTQKLGATLDALAVDPTIAAIVLDIDSPGGSVFGVPELASKIHSLRARKPIVAAASGLMASAAYWLGSAASEVVASPSSQVGSIGVLAAHEDWSRFDDRRGITTTLIHAGKYKVEGNPFEPLGEEAKAAMQKMVDDYYELFVGAVAQNRSASVAAVKGGFGEGRVVRAAEAVELGMIDRIETLEQTLQRLSTETGARQAIAAKGHAVNLCERELSVIER